MRRNEADGFVLMTTLILSALMTILVLTQLSNNQLEMLMQQNDYYSRVAWYRTQSTLLQIIRHSPAAGHLLGEDHCRRKKYQFDYVGQVQGITVKLSAWQIVEPKLLPAGCQRLARHLFFIEN